MAFRVLAWYDMRAHWLFILTVLSIPLFAGGAIADPTTLTCTSTSGGLTCAFAGQPQAAPQPVADAFYLLVDNGFAAAVGAGVCPPEGTCVHSDAAGVDMTEHTNAQTGQREYTGTWILLP